MLKLRSFFDRWARAAVGVAVEAISAQLSSQACDEKNLLSFDALKEISEFEDMLEQEEPC